MEKAPVYPVGTFKPNAGPVLFDSLHVAYNSVDEAVEAALSHWTANHGKGVRPAHLVYRADGGEAFMVEILPGGKFTPAAVYKIPRMYFVEGPGAQAR